MRELTELVAIWLPEGLCVTQPPVHVRDEAKDILYGWIEELEIIHPITQETIFRGRMWILLTPLLPVDETGLILPEVISAICRKGAAFLVRLERLSYKHRAAWNIIVQTPTDEYDELGRAPGIDNLVERDAYETMYRLGYVWDGLGWSRPDKID